MDANLPGLIADDRAWRRVAKPPPIAEVKQPAGEATGHRRRHGPVVWLCMILISLMGLVGLILDILPALLLALAGGAVLIMELSKFSPRRGAENTGSRPQVSRTDFIGPRTRALSDRAVDATSALAASPLAEGSPQARIMLAHFLFRYLVELRRAEAAGRAAEDYVDKTDTATALETLAQRSAGLPTTSLPMPTTTTELNDAEFLHWVDAALSDNHM